MRILYFDVRSLLYSQRYIDSDKRVLSAYRCWLNSGTSSGLLTAVKPEQSSIEALRSAASVAGMLLYPLGERYTRSMLIESGLFADSELAPDVHLKIRIGDRDPIRRMLNHAQTLSATWYVCGDCYDGNILQSNPERYLGTMDGQGLTPELLDKIQAL
ncbi:hypothetical protein Q2Y22_001288 [Vibrio vulnificus]|nr:hypothetical protein [Vibrio vulnificus]